MRNLVKKFFSFRLRYFISTEKLLEAVVDLNLLHFIILISAFNALMV